MVNLEINLEPKTKPNFTQAKETLGSSYKLNDAFVMTTSECLRFQVFFPDWSLSFPTLR